MSSLIRWLHGLGLSVYKVRSVWAAIGPVSNIHIVNKDIAPDGFTRPAVLAASSPRHPSFPGPVIKGYKGNNFRLNVQNSLTDSRMLRSTSIHWHGIFQHGSSWADGPVGVTQCPIVPGDSFLYDFTVPDQAGTFWYHSHYSTQYCDGLRGPLVIYDPIDPHRSKYDVDDDNTIITLADWYHTPAPSAGNRPEANSTLINGRGRYAGGPLSPLSEIKVSRGLRYRFRLIAISCAPNYVFSIDGHNLTVIEADGVSVEPVTVDSIHIFAGQRYSFILHADKPIGNYWIRAQPNEGNKGFSNGINSAILRYAYAPHSDPTTSLGTGTDLLLETNLHPLVNPGAPGKPFTGGADVAMNLEIGLEPGHFTINGATFNPPNMPVLLQILSGKYPAQDLLPEGSVYTLPPNKVIELTIPAFRAGGPHPFHLHGHVFSVVRSAGSAVYNYHNPVQRDVVSIGYPGDNVTIRFITDNSGPWFFHCHIDWHLQAGLAIVFAEDVPAIAKSKPPPAWDQLCPKYAKFPSEL
ncbi:hypothetical protein APHAL10511_005191 [Amanita phalloides]|nr:hypothetical protein APHAL10511_005191 [Amanita phalloides]